MKLAAAFAGLLCCASLTSMAVADDRPRSATALVPHLGMTSESDVMTGAVQFSDGDIDFISIDPRNAWLLGLEISHRFRDNLFGVLALSYASADARYIENNDLRPDVSVGTLRIQPGVMVPIVRTPALELALGGGLHIARMSIDGLVWNDRFFDTSALALGVFGAASIDVPLTPRLAFHAHLGLELSRTSLGGLEDALARADGETGAELASDTRTALQLVVGLAIGL